MAPVEAFRQQLERLRSSRKPRVLFVTHAFGGGVARHIDELATAIAPDVEVLLLQPYRQSAMALRRVHGDEELVLWPRTATDWDALVDLLRAIGIDRVHFHHVHGLPREVLDLPRRLGCGHDLTLHDYFPACPQYHLRDGNGRHCEANSSCHRCLESGPAQWPMSVDEWRAAFRPLVASAGRLIAPSNDAAERIRAFFPEASPVVWPHAQAASDAAAAPLRVLVPGAISPAKGLDLLEACIRDAHARGLPLHFRVVGYIANPIPHWPQLPFSLSGEYPDGKLAELLALEGGDAIFFPAQCPETFSYTLSDALDLALPIVATDLGALRERLSGRPGAHIVPWDATPGAINDAILAAVPDRAAAPHPAPRASVADYRARYLEGIRAMDRRADTALPKLDPRWLVEPPDEKDPATMEGLFDDGVLCGRATSLEELRRLARHADGWMIQAVEELHRQQAKLAAGADELAGARAEAVRQAERAAAAEVRLRLVEGSRSWKLTAPLRAVLRWLGRGA